jgi:hypothetical protein
MNYAIQQGTFYHHIDTLYSYLNCNVAYIIIIKFDVNKSYEFIDARILIEVIDDCHYFMIID